MTFNEKSESSKYKQQEELFKKIHFRVQEIGISSSELTCLKSIETLESYKLSLISKRQLCFQKCAKIFAGSLLMVSLTMSLCFCLHYFSISQLTGTILWQIFRLDFKSYPHQCIFAIPESVSYFLRPVSDCSFCRNVTSFARLENISAEDFEERFVRPRQIAVIVDGHHAWNYESLKNLYTETGYSPILDKELLPESPYRQPTYCGISRFTSGFKNVEDMFSRHSSEELNSTDGHNAWFIGWENCDTRVQAFIEKKFPLPYFLKNRKQPPLYVFHMSSKGHGSPYHIDTTDYIWQAQLQGQKKWFAQPPPECYFKCKSYYVEAVVNPGEFVFVPASTWFHGTQIVGRDFSISITSNYHPY